MTPAINTAGKAKIDFKIHEYSHDPRADSYGQEAAEKLGIDPDQVFKTLVVSIDTKGLGVAILPVSCQLNLKLLARAMGVKKRPWQIKSPGQNKRVCPTFYISIRHYIDFTYLGLRSLSKDGISVESCAKHRQSP